MLKGISPLISPELLKILAEMGHGDEIVLADAHFPGHSLNKTIVRADGLQVTQLLEGILPLFQMDQYVECPFIMMQAVAGDVLDENVEKDYREVITQSMEEAINIERIERFAFYERTKTVYAIVMTGTTAKYGNIILKKGVTPI